jgi:hypothetical protein
MARQAGCLGDANHLGAYVYRGHGSAVLDEPLGERAGSAAGIEHPQSAGRPRSFSSGTWPAL